METENNSLMQKRIIILICLVLSSFITRSQNLIPVADLSFKMSGNSIEEFYYSFAKGDVLYIDFEISKGKGVKFEIIELPNQIKTNLFTANLINYRVNIPSTKVYLFRITNVSGNKICSLNIRRIPKSRETVDFNTGWEWKTLYDTTYTHYSEDSLVGHDTIHYMETVKEVTSKEVLEVILEDKIQEIRSAGVIVSDNPRAFVEIKLPQNQNGTNWEKKVVGWGYWLCVGDNSNSIWSQNKDLVAKSASTIAGAAFGLGPVGSFIAGGVTSLFIPNAEKADNVKWSIVQNGQDVNAFMTGGPICPSSCLKNGDGPGAAGRFVDKNTQGTYYLCLYNDNIHDRIRVTIKVSAIVETITYKDVDYPRTRIVPKFVKVPKVRRNISSRQIRVPVEESMR